MGYTFLKFSNFARVCNRLGERLCFETSQGIRPPIPLRSYTPPLSWRGREGVSECCRVAVCQAHSVGSIGR